MFKKRIVITGFIIFILIAAMSLSASAVGSLYNFKEMNTYSSGEFTDVSSTEWYASYVEIAYEYGLVNGTSATTFTPNKNLTLAEAIKLASCLHSIYNTGSTNFEVCPVW